MTERVPLRRAVSADASAVRELSRSAYAKWVPLIGREPMPMTADYERAVSEHAPASTVKIERRATGPECTAGRQSSAVATPGSCASSSTISSA